MFIALALVDPVFVLFIVDVYPVFADDTSNAVPFAPVANELIETAGATLVVLVRLTVNPVPTPA
jgi:hypothetical protein